MRVKFGIKDTENGGGGMNDRCLIEAASARQEKVVSVQG